MTKAENIARYRRQRRFQALLHRMCHAYGEPRCITEEPTHGWRRRTPDGRFAPKETRMG